MSASSAKRDSRRLSRKRLRSGMAAIELVMTTAIMLPIFAFGGYWMIRSLRVIYTVIGAMVGSPLF